MAQAPPLAVPSFQAVSGSYRMRHPYASAGQPEGAAAMLAQDERGTSPWRVCGSSPQRARSVLPALFTRPWRPEARSDRFISCYDILHDGLRDMSIDLTNADDLSREMARVQAGGADSGTHRVHDHDLGRRQHSADGQFAERARYAGLEGLRPGERKGGQ